MSDRQTLWPQAWLMTDERMGDRLWDAIGRLPPGAGIVFRHHSLDRGARVALGRAIAEHCRAKGLTLAVSRDIALAKALRASLVHNPTAPAAMPFSRAVHGEAEAFRARDDGASLVFVSPIHSTRSHPAVSPLGVDEAVRLAGLASAPAIALGGMDGERFAALHARGFVGWAGIDAWLRI